MSVGSVDDAKNFDQLTVYNLTVSLVYTINSLTLSIIP